MADFEFTLDDFVENPTWDKLDECTKAQLKQVAECYKIKVNHALIKPVVFKCLSDALVERGVLDERDGATGVAVNESAAEAKAEADPASGIDPVRSDPPAADNLRLTLRMKEVELETKQLEVQAMHLRVRALELERERTHPVSTAVTSTGLSDAQARLGAQTSGTGGIGLTPGFATGHSGFDVSKHIALVPPFRETEVDSYFCAFERIAAALQWPRDVWSLLLQCKLVGKAQEVCATLSIDQSLNYEIVKATVLRAYELVPEAYRQRFRQSQKAANQTFVEFAREKSALFDKWCQASKVTQLDQLRELVLLEEFKNCLPDKIVLYLNEQKVVSLEQAAVHADEFVVTHKSVFSVPCAREVFSSGSSERRQRSPKPVRKSVFSASGENRECFYCREPGHLIAKCPILERKGQARPTRHGKSPSGVGLISATPAVSSPSLSPCESEKADPSFNPFISQGFVSLTGEEKDRVPVTILRDTGAYRSFILSSVLPLNENTSCNSYILV